MGVSSNGWGDTHFRKIGSVRCKLYCLVFIASILACSQEDRDYARGFRDGVLGEEATECCLDTLSTDDWTYLQIDSAKAMWGDFDEPDWLRYFGLAAGDLNGDGYQEIVSGRNVYLNPGGDMSGAWEKIDLGRNVDANLVYRKDNETMIIGEALPEVVRFTSDGDDEDWTSATTVARMPATGHHNGQGYKIAEVFAGNSGDEIIYASQGGLYVLEPGPDLPWPVTLVGKDASDEGFGVADMDGDGDNDLVSGYRMPGADAEVPTVVVWFENPGSEAKITDSLTIEGVTVDHVAWRRHALGRTQFATDRVEAADLDGDGRPEVVVAEERYPGLEPDASLYIYFQRDTGWQRQTVVTQFSMNNLALVDMDLDGDTDILTSEHKGEALSLQLWKNDGTGYFERQEIDRGKESHLGTQPYDLDGDGDLDIVSIGWDQHQYVHLWRNDAKRN